MNGCDGRVRLNADVLKTSEGKTSTSSNLVRTAIFKPEKESLKMKNNADYDSVFNESDSYLEMLLTVTLKGGNKAKMNRFLQKSWQLLSHTYSYRWSNKERKLVLFIKEGITEGEIPMKFLWNMLNCPKSIDEINKC